MSVESLISNPQSIHNLSYLFIFLLMCIEGPILTFIASATASLGYLNIWVVFVIAILGNVIPDSLFYIIGRSIRGPTMEGLIKYFKVSNKKLKTIELAMHKHAVKTLILIKFVMPIPGLFVAGFVKIPFRKYFMTIFIFNILSAIIFASLGYYSGLAVNSFVRYVKLTELILPIFAVVIILILILINYIHKNIRKIPILEKYKSFFSIK